MKDKTLYITKAKLVATVGSQYKSILKDLVDQGIVKGFEDAMAVTFDKDKARHIETVLEFYDNQDGPDNPKKANSNEDDK